MGKYRKQNSGEQYFLGTALSLLPTAISLGKSIFGQEEKPQEPPKPIEVPTRFENGGSLKDYIQKAQTMRKGARQNPDGSYSTHLMRAETLDGKNWVAFPSLFENEDGSWQDMSNEEDTMSVYKEAKKRGEVFDFGQNKEAALDFGKGSWKGNMQIPSKELPRVMEMGGMLTPIEAGGRHHENQLGGVPIGNNASVEEGETMTDNFVYSDRLKINKTLAKEYYLPKSVIGKTFAEASKMLTLDQTDKISERGNKAMLSRLAESQESYKQYKYGGNIPGQMALGGPTGLEGIEKEISILRELGSPGTMGDNSSNVIADAVGSVEEVIKPKTSAPATRKQELLADMGTPTLKLGDTQKAADRDIINVHPDVLKEEGIANAQNQINNNKTISNPVGKNAFNPLRYAPLVGDAVSLSMLSKNKPEMLRAGDFQTNTSISENLVNRSQAERNIKDAGKTSLNSLSGATGGNAAQMMALGQSQGLNTQRALGEFQMQSDAQDSQEKARVQGMRANQDRFNAQVSMNVQQMNDQNQGNYTSAMMDSVSNLFNNVGAVGQEQTNVNLVNQMFGYDVHGRYKQALKRGDTTGSFSDWLKNLRP